MATTSPMTKSPTQDPLYFESIKVGTRVRTPNKGYGRVVDSRKAPGKKARPDVLVELDTHPDTPEPRQFWYSVAEVEEQ